MHFDDFSYLYIHYDVHSNNNNNCLLHELQPEANVKIQHTYWCENNSDKCFKMFTVDNVKIATFEWAER